MVKKMGTGIVLCVLFVLILTGCNRPASKGATEIPEQPFTTPIVIQTDSPILITQTEVAKYVATATLSEDGGPLTSPTPTIEPTEVIIIPTMTVPAEYTIQAGELVYCLGRRFDVDPDDIISLNGLSADGALDIGDVLEIPTSGSWSYGPRRLMDHPTTYTVEAGDTIYTIACAFGDVYPEEIIAANKLEEPYDLTAGETINIP
jgi:LysM repeat protein